MPASIAESILAALAGTASRKLPGSIALKDVGTTTVDFQRARSAISEHLEMVAGWATNIAFRDLRGTRALTENFVDLDIELGYLATRRRTSSASTRRISDLIMALGNVVLLGDAGAGKTTSLKRFALELLRPETQRSGHQLPVLVVLRDLRRDATLITMLLETFGVKLKYDRRLSSTEKHNAAIQALVHVLSNASATILVDGLDELSRGVREKVVSDLRSLLARSRKFRIVLTCRTADFSYSLDRAEVYVLEPLSDAQIKEFVNRWLGPESGAELLAQIRQTPYGGSEVLPLTLAHLCAIYQRTGSVPEKPRTVYRKIVRLLLEEWDEQRSLKRASEYANFEVDRKEDFLRAIAYQLTLNRRSVVFDHWSLESAYGEICEHFGLPKSAARTVVREVESHTGLIVQASYDSYEFAHKSLQEYLTAEYILRLPRHPYESVVRLPNEMALATALSSDPNAYLFSVVRAATAQPEQLRDFTAPFLRRLLVEKVDFSPHETLALALIRLYAATCFPVGGESLLTDAARTAFADLLRQQHARSSIQTFLRKTPFRPDGVGTWRILGIAAELARRERIERLAIDDSFLLAAGLTIRDGKIINVTP